MSFRPPARFLREGLSALIVTAAAAAACAKLWWIGTAAGAGGSPAVLATVVALSLGRRTFASRAEFARSAALLPVVGLAAGAVGWLLVAVPPIGAALFVAGMSIPIWMRRFGPRAARGVDDAIGAATHGRRKQLGLISVIADRDELASKTDRNAKDNERCCRSHLRECKAAHDYGERTADDQIFALDFIGEKHREQWPDWQREGDHKRVQEAFRHGDPLTYEQSRHPVREAVVTDGMTEVEDD